VLITTAVFLWVPRYLSGEHHYLKNVINTAAFSAAVTVFYIPLAGTLNRITDEAAIDNVLVSIRSVSAFNWFWDATLFLVLLGIAYAWSYYNRYAIENKRAAELAVSNERLGAELARLELDLLRAQLEPHFLFNALNSISALIRSAKTDAATDALESLSELLRYAIESGQENTVTLAEEAAAADEYLRLQKLRFGERLMCSVELADDTQDARVPPMLLQPLLENAVQHGLRDTLEPAKISLKMNCEDGALHIVVENTVAPKSRETSSAGFGVGLANIERRLACLYPDQHTFDTKIDGGRFVASVSLPSGVKGNGNDRSD
jgi:sensor histidine kinase YesM